MDTLSTVSTGSRALTSDDCSKGLKTLGFHPVAQRHALLELSLPSLALGDIDILRDYPNVMYLDVSDNQIRSLNALRSMTALIQLRARNNKLTECLRFAPKHCKEGNSWPEGKRAVGSMLTLADVSDNEIERMGDLSPHRFLECLLMSNNCIAWIEGLRNLRFLQTLDLSGNKITRLEGLDNLPLRELRLSRNELTTLDGLDKLPCLSALDVSYNRIKTLSPLQALPHLNYLDVRGNELQFLRQTEFLVHCEWLHVLCITDNPCSLKPHYRLRVLFRLPHLQRLDSVLVSPEEKIRALNLYRAPQGDLDQRAGVLGQLCPDLCFVDFAPQQLPYDEEEDITPQELALGELLPVIDTSSLLKEDAVVGKALETSLDEPSTHDGMAGDRVPVDGRNFLPISGERLFGGGDLDREEEDRSTRLVPNQ